MPFSRYKSTSSHRTNNGTSFRATASVLIVVMVATLFPVLVEAAGEQARSAIESVINLLGKRPSNKKPQVLSTQDFKDPSTRAAEVKSNTCACAREDFCCTPAKALRSFRYHSTGIERSYTEQL